MIYIYNICINNKVHIPQYIYIYIYIYFIVSAQVGALFYMHTFNMRNTAQFSHLTIDIIMGNLKAEEVEVVCQ